MNDKKKGVQVIIEDLDEHPKCSHGPTILFSTHLGQRYFSCSCYRDLKFCPFKVNLEDYLANPKKYQALYHPINHYLSYEEVKTQHESSRKYCNTCEVFFTSSNLHGSHKIIQGITNSDLLEPSLIFLDQKNNDKKEAQYFFNQRTLQFILSIFKQLKLGKVICMGAPRLHEFLKKNGVRSLLLDIDRRLKYFNRDEDYCYFNMCNFHFFDVEDEQKLDVFLVENLDERVCLFTDPPFGCRSEIITDTIQKMSKRYILINKHHTILPIFWVFPYFMENYILKYMPQMKVMDYQVCYTNHKTYKEDGRKDGSPVRIFTNVPLSSISYPQSEKRYKFCPDCQLFSSKSNPHCKICRKCPSKSGATYKHCPDCQKCIKPTYQHCKNCTRCVQKVHNCIDFQKNQECQLCLIKGHVEVRCKKFRHLLKLKKKGACRLCGLTKGHVIKDCPMRERLLGEQYFMGDVLRD